VIVSDPTVLRVTSGAPPTVVGEARGTSTSRVNYRSSLQRATPPMGRTIVVAAGTLVSLRGIEILSEAPSPRSLDVLAPRQCVTIRGAGTFLDGTDYYQGTVSDYTLTATPSGRITQRAGDVWCASESEGEVQLRLCVAADCVQSAVGVFAAGSVESLMATVTDTTPVFAGLGVEVLCVPVTFEATIRGEAIDVTDSRLLTFSPITPVPPFLRGNVGFMGGQPCAAFTGPAPETPRMIDVGVSYAGAFTTVSLSVRGP
jgi:hypothetical protein